ncbi:MAG: hypothetical protein J7L71_03395 [Spirochaetaceae bacterium]|nr:hypothetical protein [Spirochaetaceae bacterium]
MSVINYIETQPLFEITKYKSKIDYRSAAVSFTGSARKHPYDNEKLLLVTEPFSNNTVFYEFRLKDIVHYDDLPGIATDSGENLMMIKLWINKGSLGLKYEPFEVDNPIKFMKDSELLHQILKDTDNHKPK